MATPGRQYLRQPSKQLSLRFILGLTLARPARLSAFHPPTQHYLNFPLKPLIAQRIVAIRGAAYRPHHLFINMCVEQDWVCFHTG